MAEAIARGQVWMLRRERPDKRRPVLVLSRDGLLAVLQTATVALITSTRRGSPIEVELGVADGLKADCAVNLANVFTVEKSLLHQYVATLSEAKMARICAALALAVGCDDE